MADGGMEKAITDFPRQFAWMPDIRNYEGLAGVYTRFLVSGMGGSHLAADLLKRILPDADIAVRSDYGLGAPNEYRDRLIIANSYSGNTEEVLDAARESVAAGLPTAAIAIGGKLIDFAREKELPHIIMPDTGIQPRSALGFNLRALAIMMGLSDVLSESRRLVDTLAKGDYRADGERLAGELSGLVPVIYASRVNATVAYNWKIKCNETGKIPAFYNVFPELNHNEMAGFDVIDSTRSLSKNLAFIFLSDEADHPRVARRMRETRLLYEDRGLRCIDVPITGSDIYTKIFSSLATADWMALALACANGAEAEQVPIIESFKRAIAD